MLANEFIRLPYQFMGLVPPWISGWGKEHKEFVRNAFRRTIVVMGPVQEMPLADARVQVDPKVKDKWGIPVARLSGTRHPHTIEMARFIAGKGGGLAEGGWCDSDLEARAGQVSQRRTASGRDLPHGQRSQDLSGESRLPDPRCG